MLLWVIAVFSVAIGVTGGAIAGWFADGAFWLPVLLAVGSFVGLIFLFLALVVVSAVLIRMEKTCEKDSAYFRWLSRQVIYLGITAGGVKVHTTGTELVPKDGRFLLVCNHLYDLDPAVILYVLPDCQLAFISKKENDKIPIVGKVMHKLMCLPIDRENDRAALRTILKAVEYLKQDKVSVAIFPEGYVSKTGELLPFRNGAFKIAQKAGVPVVVSVLTNTKPLGKNLFRRRTDVWFDILQTIPTEAVQAVSTKELGDRIHATMEAAIARRTEKL